MTDIENPGNSDTAIKGYCVNARDRSWLAPAGNLLLFLVASATSGTPLAKAKSARDTGLQGC